MKNTFLFAAVLGLSAGCVVSSSPDAGDPGCAPWRSPCFTNLDCCPGMDCENRLCEIAPPGPGHDAGAGQDSGTGSDAGNLNHGYCGTCNSSADCGGGNNLCLVPTAGGANFCGVDCSLGQACPSGASCAQITNGNGQGVGMNCVPTNGSCASASCQSGSPCSTGADCCAGLFCETFANGNFCAPSGAGTPTCGEPGTLCGGACCSGLSCASIGECALGTSSCEVTCQSNLDCSCAGYTCHGAVCSQGQACVANGAACTRDTDCCSGNGCQGGLCIGMSCHGQGDTCGAVGSTLACCTGVCSGNVCSCVANGASCNQSSECCGGNCANHVCEPLPPPDAGPCLNLGATCNTGGTCCGGTTCGYQSKGAGATGCNVICCIANSGSCTQDSDCCGYQDGLGCYTGVACTGGKCCEASTAICATNADCCSGVCNPGHLCQ